MKDASASSTTAVLRGSIYNMGDFTQCLTARAPFPTQYCLATVIANVPPPNTTRSPFSLHFDPYESLSTKLYVSFGICGKFDIWISVGFVVLSIIQVYHIVFM